MFYSPAAIAPTITFIFLLLSNISFALPIFTLEQSVSYTNFTVTATVSYKLFETCLHAESSTGSLSRTVCTGPLTTCGSRDRTLQAAQYMLIISSVAATLSVFFGCRRTCNPDVYNVGGSRLRFVYCTVFAGVLALISFLCILALFGLKWCDSETSVYKNPHSKLGAAAYCIMASAVMMMASSTIDLKKNGVNGVSTEFLRKSLENEYKPGPDYQNPHGMNVNEGNGEDQQRENNTNGQKAFVYKRPEVVSTSQKRKMELNRAIEML